MTAEALHRARSSIGGIVAEVERHGHPDLCRSVAERLMESALRLLDHASRSHRSDPALHVLNARTHACRRVWERFHRVVTPTDLGRLEQSIRDGNADWLADLDGPRQAYVLNLGGRRVVFVFDIRLDAIVTALSHARWLSEYGRDAA